MNFGTWFAFVTGIIKTYFELYAKKYFFKPLNPQLDD